MKEKNFIFGKQGRKLKGTSQALTVMSFIMIRKGIFFVQCNVMKNFFYVLKTFS